MGLNEPLKELPIFWKDPHEAGNRGVLWGRDQPFVSYEGGQSSVAFKSVTLETSACPLVVVWVFNLKGSHQL